MARDYNDEYTDYFKLFILANYKDLIVDEEKGTPLNYTRGYSPLGTNYGVMLSGHDKFTIAHECLHGLGLPHSFFSNSFLFEALKTDNIMDYFNTSLIYNHNQIKIMRSDIQNFLPKQCEFCKPVNSKIKQVKK